MMAACREQTAVQGPFVAATATATPRSTPLPAVATVMPPGIESNPIQMVINPVGSASVVTDAQVATFEESIAAETGLVVDVTLVDRSAEALAALCESSTTNVTVAWLDSLTYQAAAVQNCGEPVMVAERDGAGTSGQIIARSQSEVSSIQALVNRSFCRLGYDDYFSWLVPSLLMRTAGVDPVDDLESVQDFGTVRQMVSAVVDGECDAAGISESDFEDLPGATRDELTVLDTTPPLPHAVLVYPINLPLGERIRLDNALLAMNASPDGRSAMRPLLGQDDLQRVSEDSFEELAVFLVSTGLDFAQLGD